MHKQIITILFTALFLSGCDDPVVIAQANQQQINSGGEDFATLPDGRQIKRIILRASNGHPHFIYIVDGATTVTQNQETGGKHSYNAVSATITLNGETYQKVELDKKQP